MEANKSEITEAERPLKHRARASIPVPRLVLIISIILAIAAWAFGYFSNGTNVLPLVPKVIPGTSRVEIRGSLYVALDQSGNIVGYAAVGEGQGYAGPIDMLVGTNSSGEITGAMIIAQRETPGFFRLILGHDLVGQFVGLKYNAPLSLGQDVDAVSGATFSSEGIASSIRAAVRTIAQNGLNSPLPPEKRSIKFGIPEIVLLGLYAAGYFGHKIRSGKWKRRIRWGTLLTGMVVLGFIYTLPLTIAQIVSLLSGFWPDWHTNLYWYLLIGGILFVTTVDAKNPYCGWFCPFGAVQECLAQLTHAKLYRPRKLNKFFTWLHRGLAFGAVLLGLVLRRPGLSSYEPYATIFDLRGTAIEWIFLGVILLASLVMYRPFCNYLCPLDPVYDFIAEGRRWVRQTWLVWREKAWKK
jgi:NosR/NirI family nitrous oxide reductase transcriptional regulator